ncbi:uncharacterized protein LOC144675757, partial [Cetorhinus maximus]
MVHVYNPFVPVADVVTFLTRYFDKVGSGTEIRDDLGIWTGKRLFKVTLKTDGKGAIFHPPSSFAIGGNRGYLVYAGQPKHCRSCGKAGHVAANCSASLCKICKQEGHQTKDCKQAKCCNLCGEASHLYRTCPKRCRTYAQAAKADHGEAEEMFRVTPTTKAPRELNGTKEDTERDKVEKEIEATESQSTAPPPEPSSPQDSESMEEEAAVEKQQGEWRTVKNKKSKRERRRSKGVSQRSGKRRLPSDTDDKGSSSSDEEVPERHRQKRRQSSRALEDETPELQKIGDNKETNAPQLCLQPEEASAPQPLESGSSEAIIAPQLQEAGNSNPPEGVSFGEASPAKVISKSAHYVNLQMPLEQNTAKEIYLSPSKVKEFELTTGMKEQTKGLGLSETVVLGEWRTVKNKK